jgi:hypothetical protein
MSYDTKPYPKILNIILGVYVDKVIIVTGLQGELL